MQAREPVISNTERQCVLDLLLKKKRLDGRKALEFRNIDISFTDHLGGCVVNVGDTKVFSQVSCQIAKPKTTRPNEGILFVNLDFTPMASPSFEADRLNEMSIEANRIIERCLLDSRCLDMESLCIISGEVVWQIKLDIRVLNHEGNIIDACCISAISSLCNFKRPDVTVYATEQHISNEEGECVGGGEVEMKERPPGGGCVYGRMKFHSSTEKALITLNMQHLPVCVTLCFYDGGKHIVVDPTRIEEVNIQGKMVVAVNNQKEVCTLHLSCGGLMLTKPDFISSVHKASKICCETIVVKIKEALKQNEMVRKSTNLQSQLESKLRMSHETPIAPLREGDKREVSTAPSYQTTLSKRRSKSSKTVTVEADVEEDYNTTVDTFSNNTNVKSLLPKKSNWIISSSLGPVTQTKLANLDRMFISTSTEAEMVSDGNDDDESAVAVADKHNHNIPQVTGSFSDEEEEVKIFV